jgi:hypothetical protein
VVEVFSPKTLGTKLSNTLGTMPTEQGLKAVSSMVVDSSACLHGRRVCMTSVNEWYSSVIPLYAQPCSSLIQDEADVASDEEEKLLISSQRNTYTQRRIHGRAGPVALLACR